MVESYSYLRVCGVKSTHGYTHLDRMLLVERRVRARGVFFDAGAQVEHSITYPPFTLVATERQRDHHVILGCISCRKISSHRTYYIQPIRYFSLVVITKKRNGIRNMGEKIQTLRRKLTLIKLTRGFDVITFEYFGKV